jgi:hypothetical protein
MMKDDLAKMRTDLDEQESRCDALRHESDALLNQSLEASRRGDIEGTRRAHDAYVRLSELVRSVCDGASAARRWLDTLFEMADDVVRRTHVR